MPRVFYLGPESIFSHPGPGTDFPFIFIQGQGTPVNTEVAKFYEKEAENGGPWRVEFTPVVEAVKKVKKKIKGNK